MSRARRNLLRAAVVVLAVWPASDLTATSYPARSQPAPTTRADREALQEVTTAERAFSKLSADRGMKAAFLANLSDSGVIFQPMPVNGKKSWNARQSPRSTLSWEPAWAEVSFGGDFAVTTGPWILGQPPSEKAPARHGRFLSVWRRQARGWKVEADIGITHERPYRGVGGSTFRAGPEHPAPGPLPERLDLAALDRTISNGRGMAESYSRAVTDDFQFLRGGYFPYDRPVDAIAAMDSLGGRVELTQLGAGVARTQDLAFTYGTLERFAADGRTAVDTTVYFHVWRRLQTTWKVAMAVHNPSR